jgi:hypothetical protein
MSVSIVGKLTARIDRIAVLEKQIEWIEAHSRSHYRFITMAMAIITTMIALDLYLIPLELSLIRF